MSTLRRLARIALTSADPVLLAGFYEAALGFERIGDSALESEPASRLFGVASDAVRVLGLRLGDERIDLVGFSPRGAPYPGDVPGWSPRFQHVAIIVSDMEAAYARLGTQAGWQPISEDGPQRLPKSSGGVTAYKFRDPEGHPLEFLAFPADGTPELWNRPNARDVRLGIDHSAISVADTDRSVRFYETLGCAVAMRSHNLGPEQARLDGIAEPDVVVTGLSLAGQEAPHVELLCYHGAFDRALAPLSSHDVASTRLVFAMGKDALDAACALHVERLISPGPITWRDGRVDALLRDPDGHQILLTTDIQ